MIHCMLLILWILCMSWTNSCISHTWDTYLSTTYLRGSFAVINNAYVNTNLLWNYLCHYIKFFPVELYNMSYAYWNMPHLLFTVLCTDSLHNASNIFLLWFFVLSAAGQEHWCAWKSLYFLLWGEHPMPTFLSC